MSSRASKKSKSMIKRKTWMRKKKVSCECSGSILKKTKQTTATKNKKQFTHQSDSESHCGLLTRKKERKEITTSDSRAAISSSAPPKWRKTKKKNRNRKRFSCFFNNTTKGRTFQFLMTISMPARPPAPFKPLRMNVNRHYYIKTKKQEKINSHPPPKKRNVWPAKT